MSVMSEELENLKSKPLSEVTKYRDDLLNCIAKGKAVSASFGVDYPKELLDNLSERITTAQNIIDSYMTPFQKLIKKLKISFSYVEIDWKNATMKQSEWPNKHKAYTCTFTYKHKTLITPFFTSQDIVKADEVLDCIFTDASFADNAKDFDDFCNDLDYNNDSIKDLAIYKACKKEAKDLKAMFGSKLYKKILLMDRER